MNSEFRTANELLTSMGLSIKLRIAIRYGAVQKAQYTNIVVFGVTQFRSAPLQHYRGQFFPVQRSWMIEQKCALPVDFLRWSTPTKTANLWPILRYWYPQLTMGNYGGRYFATVEATTSIFFLDVFSVCHHIVFRHGNRPFDLSHNARYARRKVSD